VVTGDINPIAEIRCNKHINSGYKLGAEQKVGQIKAINGSLEGKYKVKSVDQSECSVQVLGDLWFW